MDAEEADGTLRDVYTETEGLPMDDVAGAPSATITTTNDCSINGCGFAVGNQIRVKSNVADHDTFITAIAVNGNKVDITLNAAQAVSTGVKLILRNDTRALKIRPEFKILTVVPAPRS